jgi:hypothetical protein
MGGETGLVAFLGRRMFDYDPPKEKEPPDYSDLIIALMLTPVFILVTYLKSADTALSVCVVLGMTLFAIKLRWYLRKHVWFWAIIVFILTLHVPLVFIFRWPHGNVPIRDYAIPIGIVDFFIIIVAIDTADRIFSKDSSFTTINWR